MAIQIIPVVHFTACEENYKRLKRNIVIIITQSKPGQSVVNVTWPRKK